MWRFLPNVKCLQVKHCQRVMGILIFCIVSSIEILHKINDSLTQNATKRNMNQDQYTVADDMRWPWLYKHSLNHCKAPGSSSMSRCAASSYRADKMRNYFPIFNDDKLCEKLNFSSVDCRIHLGRTGRVHCNVFKSICHLLCSGQ